MKKHRFNTRVGRSAGLGTYRNTGRDYPSFYRTLYERGRPDLIVATVDYSTTIYGGSSYIDVLPIQRSIDDTSNVWSESYWLHEEVVAWTFRRMNDIRRVYDFMIDKHGKEFFDEHYTPVFYDNIDTSIQKDFSLFAKHLMEDCAVASHWIGKSRLQRYDSVKWNGIRCFIFGSTNGRPVLRNIDGKSITPNAAINAKDVIFKHRNNKIIMQELTCET